MGSPLLGHPQALEVCHMGELAQWLCVLWLLRGTVVRGEEGLEHRFQLDTAMRFLGIELPNQPALCRVQSSLGELALRWGTPALGHRWEVPPLASLASSHLSRCSPGECAQHPQPVGATSSVREAPHVCLVSAAPRRCQLQCVCVLVWGSVSSSGVPQAEDGVTPLWALAPLLDQKLPEDRAVATFLIAAPPAPSTVGPGPEVFSVRRNDGTCLVSRCESVHTDMCVCVCVCVCVLFCVYPKENNSIRLQ